MGRFEIHQTYLAPGPGPVGLAWDGRLLWNADFVLGKIFRVNPDTGESTASLVCPGNLSGLAWNGRFLWQSLHDGGALSRINSHTNDFDQTIMVHDHGWLSGLAWDGKLLWAASQQHGKLFAIDQESGDVVREIPAPVAIGGLTFHEGMLWAGVPETMRFHAAEQRFEWVSTVPSYALVQIDPADGQILARYALDFLPMGLAWVGLDLWMSHTGGMRLVNGRLVSEKAK